MEVTIDLERYIERLITERMRDLAERLERLEAALAGSSWIGYGPSPDEYRAEIVATLTSVPAAPPEAAEAEAAAAVAEEAAAVAIDAAEAAEDAAEDAAEAAEAAEEDEDEGDEDEDEGEEAAAVEAAEAPAEDERAPARTHPLRRRIIG